MKDDKKADMKGTRNGRKKEGIDKRLHACMHDNGLHFNEKYTANYNASVSKVHQVMRTLL